MRQSKAKNVILNALHEDYQMARNFREIYVWYIESKDMLFNAHVYIEQYAFGEKLLSDATINKTLEVLLVELVDEEKFKDYGFTYTEYLFFKKCRERGNKLQERARIDAIGTEPKNLANTISDDKKNEKSLSEIMAEHRNKNLNNQPKLI